MNEKQENPTPKQKKEGEPSQSDLSQKSTDATNFGFQQVQGAETTAALEQARLKHVHEAGSDLGVNYKDDPNILKNCYDRLEVRKSPIEGYGVFATGDIPKGSVLEEIPFILWPRYTQLGERIYKGLMGDAAIHSEQRGDDWIAESEKNNENVRRMFGFKTPEKYYFKWHPPHQSVMYSVIPLGFGPIYNSSNSDNNAGWVVNEKTFTFMATRDIKKGEEVCTFYGYFLSEEGEIYATTDVFGFGLDINREENQVYLRCLRFSNNEEAQARGKDAGFQKINELLGASKQKLKLRKISIVENGEEKHEFQFPENWSLGFHLKKLKEFRFSRFKNIKFLVSFEDDKQRKANQKIRDNPELIKKGKKLEERGEEFIITNFNGQ